MNATDIAAALSYRAEELLPPLLTRGRRQGNYWTVRLTRFVPASILCRTMQQVAA